MSILSKYNIYNAQTFFKNHCVSDLSLYKPFSKNILIYHILCKTPTAARTLRIKFNKIDGFIKVHDTIRYVVLFDYGLFDKLFDRIKYLIIAELGITGSINLNLWRIRVDSNNSLPIEIILTFHNVIILINSVVYRNKTNYYCNKFLESGLPKDKSDTRYFLKNIVTL